MSRDPNEYPGPTPQGEDMLADDKAFANACLSAIARDVDGFGLRLGTPVLTRNKEWGRVWRVDFQSASGSGEAFGLVNRIVCWESPGSNDIGVAFLIGRPLPKLD